MIVPQDLLLPRRSLDAGGSRWTRRILVCAHSINTLSSKRRLLKPIDRSALVFLHAGRRWLESIAQKAFRIQVLSRYELFSALINSLFLFSFYDALGVDLHGVTLDGRDAVALGVHVVETGWVVMLRQSRPLVCA